MIGPVLRLVAASAAARAIKDAATDASTRLALTLAAGAACLVGIFCFSRAALTVMERHIDSAEAWSVLGGFYAIVGGLFYFAATRRRR
jgi:hypothetical protein